MSWRFTTLRQKRTRTPLSRRFVAVEYGASPFDVPVPPNGSDETVVVAQARDEAPAAFALRLGTRLAASGDANEPVNPAILVVATAGGQQAVAARRLAAAEVLSHMAARGHGEFVIAATRAEPALRDELLGLIESLLEDFSQSGVVIRLQFRCDLPREEHRSGIHPVPSARGVAQSDLTALLRR
jgi:hypothetical protein